MLVTVVILDILFGEFNATEAFVTIDVHRHALTLIMSSLHLERSGRNVLKLARRVAGRLTDHSNRLDGFRFGIENLSHIGFQLVTLRLYVLDCE